MFKNTQVYQAKSREYIRSSFIFLGFSFKAVLICALFVLRCDSWAESYGHNFYRNEITYGNCNYSGSRGSELLKLEMATSLDDGGRFLVGWSTYSHNELNSYQKPEIGSEVQIVRCLPPGRWFYIGTGEVKSRTGNVINALVTLPTELQKVSSNSLTKLKLGNQYLRPMSGDVVLPIKAEIKSTVQITKKFHFALADIFSHDSYGKINESLTEKGKELLNNSLKNYRGKTGKILVEAYKMIKGSRDDLRVESLMIAQTVAGYIKNQLELNDTNVIPLGFGSDWLPSNGDKENLSVDTPKEGVIVRMVSF